MDNINNNTENRDGNYTYPVTGSEGSPFSQGKYPQPPEWTKNIVVSQTPWPAPDEKGNLTVKFNVSEKEDTSFNQAETDDSEAVQKKEWPMWLQVGIIVLFAVIAALLVKNAFNVRKVQSEDTDMSKEQVTTVSVGNTTIPMVVPTTVHTTVKESEKTTAKTEENNTSANKTISSQNNKKNDEKAKEEIIKYFNESSNRVKAEAVKVVKNFEKRTHNEDKLNLPSAIKGVASGLLESKFTDVTEPVEYLSREEITARYPVPGKEWSSQLTADEVSSAVCVENGDEYEITITLKSCLDPEPGTGTSKAMDCLDVPTVRDTAPPFITDFSAEYYDCVIRCRVDKESGRIVWSNYTTPVLMKLGLDAGFVKFDADIGLTFEKDYTITY